MKNEFRINMLHGILYEQTVEHNMLGNGHVRLKRLM